MIAKQVIFDDDGSRYTIFSYCDFEKVNPVEYMRGTAMLKSIALSRVPIPSINWSFLTATEKKVLKKASEDWEKQYKKITETIIPPSLLLLLSAPKKKDQVRLLKSVQLTVDILTAFICKSYSEHGYVYSRFRGEHLPEGMKREDLPRLLRIADDGTIHKVGMTNLTDGELRNALNHRSVTFAHMIEKGENWHCLFTTHNGIGGKENYNNGQPHFHYISDKFGIPRDQVIAQIKSKEYKLGNLPHIDLIGYRVQPTS